MHNELLRQTTSTTISNPRTLIHSNHDKVKIFIYNCVAFFCSTGPKFNNIYAHVYAMSDSGQDKQTSIF